MQSKVLAALLAASFGWGFAGVGTRFLFGEGATTFTVVVGRIFVATLVVLLIGHREIARIKVSAWRDGAIIGVLRIGIAPALFISSLQYVSAGIEGIFITLIPATTAALAALFIRERLDRNQILGLLIGLLGTLLIVVSGESGISEGGDIRTGAVLALIGVVAGASSGVLARKYAPRHQTTELAIPMFVAGATVAFATGLALRDIDIASVSGIAWPVLVALGAGSTFLPFFATLFASRHTSAARVALTGYLAPVIGVIAGVVLLGEVLTIPIVIGAALALSGIAVAGARRRPVPAVSG
ncbi:MAG: DMT family transporter [Actinomycetota bacterium]